MGRQDNNGRFYVSPVRTDRIDLDWQKSLTCHLVTDPIQLRDIFAQYRDTPSTMGVDSETNGLDYGKAEIAGFSFCFELSNAYYVPLTHRFGTNAPMSTLDQLFEQMLLNKTNLYWNWLFDGHIFERYGMNVDKSPYFDVQMLTWNTDVNVPMPALKDSVLRFLGIKAPSWEDTVGSAGTVQNLDPSAVYTYAACDPYFTLRLAQLLFKFYMAKDEQGRQSNKWIVDLDNGFLLALYHFMDTVINIDRARVQETVLQLNVVIQTLERKIHSMVGKPFIIRSPDKLGKVLLELGIDTGVMTKGGEKKAPQMSTDIDVLMGVRNQHPVVAEIIKYKELHKLLTAYVEPFLEYYRDDLGGFRIQYQAHNVPTARLSSGLGRNKKEIDYFAGFNIQSTPTPDPEFYDAIPSTDPDNVLGYKFIVHPQVRDSAGNVTDSGGDYESGSPELNVRSFLVAPPPDEGSPEGYYYSEFDFIGQELVIIGNLSKDPAYLDPLRRGDDIHRDFAIKRWGVEAYNKERRRVAKECRFGLQYGGYPSTLKGRMPEKTDEECEELFEDFWQMCHVLKSYQRRCVTEARKLGYFRTAMGRTRRVDFWYRSKDRRDIAFADRTVANGPIQGLGGDILRYVLLRIYQNVFLNPDFRGRIKWRSTLHDSTGFAISRHPQYFTPIVQAVVSTMTDLGFLNFEVPLRVDHSFGNSWGQTFGFSYENGVWVPKKRG